MKVIYQAENAIDANLLKDLLAQDGIMSFVNGEYLQGGMGELPAGGLITVSVADPDLNAAMDLVATFKNKTRPVSGEGETRWDIGVRVLDWKA